MPIKWANTLVEYWRRFVRVRGSVQPRCSTVAHHCCCCCCCCDYLRQRNVTFDGVNRFKMEGSGCPVIFSTRFGSLSASDDVFVFSFVVLLWASIGSARITICQKQISSQETTAVHLPVPGSPRSRSCRWLRVWIFRDRFFGTRVLNIATAMLTKYIA